MADAPRRPCARQAKQRKEQPSQMIDPGATAEELTRTLTLTRTRTETLALALALALGPNPTRPLLACL